MLSPLNHVPPRTQAAWPSPSAQPAATASSTSSMPAVAASHSDCEAYTPATASEVRVFPAAPRCFPTGGSVRLTHRLGAIRSLGRHRARWLEQGGARPRSSVRSVVHGPPIRSHPPLSGRRPASAAVPHGVDPAWPPKTVAAVAAPVIMGPWATAAGEGPGSEASASPSANASARLSRALITARRRAT